MPILDDLLSRSENLSGDTRFSFGPIRPWTYTFRDAISIALATFYAFEDDWNVAFDREASLIPARVPASFHRQVLTTVNSWVTHPESYDHRQHDRLDRFVAEEILNDGYLDTIIPPMPASVHAICYGALYLVRMNEDYRIGIDGSFSDLLVSNDAGLMPDAVAQLLLDGLPLDVMQDAVKTRVTWLTNTDDTYNGG